MISIPPAVLAIDPADASRLPLELFIVFGTAKLMGELFERLGQPGIVGEILAGVLIGPSVLDWIAPSDFLGALSQLGVMFLLFRVGLHVKASEMVRVSGMASLVAVLGVIAPLVLGWGIMTWWGQPQIEAIFTGAAMVATSVGITAQVLSTRGLMHTLAAKIILAAAVIDDVLGLIVLALVTSLARGHVQILHIILTAGLAAAFVIIVAVWGTRTARRVVPRVGEQLRASEAEFALSMTLLFGLSLLAVYAGVAAIIGAFLAGMALSESVGERVHDLAHGVTELLVPFFLAGVGMHLDLRALGSPSGIVLGGIILLAAILSKLFGCGIAALGLGRSEAARIGVGMIPRGEVGLVVAQIGLQLGVIAQQVYGVLVFMAVATTLIAPPLLTLAFKDQMRATEEEQVFRLG